ncbi:MAG: hypothetical protein JOZ96_05730 [Acidobacteria bacterium]|nr:hypothetical protein [Acidobacteriota bacterium]
MHRATVGLILSLTLGLAAPARGVQRTKGARGRQTQPSKNVVPLTPDQQSALALLEQLFEAARGFDDETLKIRTLARVADTLWPYDESRARRQFEESFRAAMSAGAAGGGGLASLTAAFMPPSQPTELQTEVLALISRRDADLAEKLIKSVAGDSPGKEGGGTQARAGAEEKARQDLYLQAALSLTESNPARSAQLAKAGLGGEINPEILKILFALRSSNPPAADELFRAALAAARRAGGRSSVNVATLAPYALPEFTTFGAGPGPTQETPDASPVAREFLDFAYDTFLQLSGVAAQLGLPGADYRPFTPSPMDYMTGQRLLPSFVRRLPDRAANFKQAVDAVARNVQQVNGADTVGKMLQAGGADELVEQAQAERNKLLKDLLYTRAAMSAMTGGDFDRALSIAEKLGDEDRRVSLGSVIRLQAASAALKKEEVDTALRYAAGVSDLRQRAFLYGSIARALSDKNDSVRAAGVLADAERDIEKAEDDAVKANALLIIAEVKTRLDPAQGFDAVGVAVKAFNRADSKGEAGRAPAAGGGSALSAVLNASLKLDTPNFEPAFVRLARVDFNRAAHLARMLERNDRSVSAQLAACRGALAARPEKKTQTAEMK